MNIISNIHNKLSGAVPDDKRNKHLSFILILLGAALDNLNVCGSISVYNSIIESFDADVPKASWTLSAYALTLGSFIMLAGKMTDILGPKAVFLSGLFLSSIFALICAVIENQIIVLIVFRAFQGVAASVMIPSMFPIAYSYYSVNGMGSALTAIMVVLTASSGVGLVIGGAFSLTNIGYKGLYYFTFALGSSVSILLYFTMYPVPVHHENKNARIRNLDWPGTAILIVGILLIILGLTEGGESWNKPSAYVPIPVGVLVVIAGLWFELVYIQNYKDMVKANQDTAQLTEKTGSSEITTFASDWRSDLQMILPRETFRITNFFPWFLSLMLLYMTFIGTFSLSVQYFQYIEGDNPLIAGLKTAPMSVGLCTGALTCKERIIYRISMKWVVVSSQVAGLGVIIWSSFHDYHHKNNYWIFEFAPLFIFGYMTNAYFGVYINAVMRNTPGHLQGVVAGLFQTGGQVGICLGNALVATLLGVLTMPQNDSERDRVDERMDRCYYLMMGFQAVAVLVLLPLKNQSSVSGSVEKPESTTETEAGNSVSDVV